MPSAYLFRDALPPEGLDLLPITSGGEYRLSDEKLNISV